jgi:hypothetical protein
LNDRLTESLLDDRTVVKRKIATTTPMTTSGSQRGIERGLEPGEPDPFGRFGLGGRSGGRLLTVESHSSSGGGVGPAGTPS